MRVPVKIVVNRVIDALFVLASVTEIERGDSDMIEKRSEVSARAQGANA